MAKRDTGFRVGRKRDMGKLGVLEAKAWKPRDGHLITAETH